MARKCQSAVAVVIAATAASVVEYLQRFNALSAMPRSGYDKYFSSTEGFVNPKSPETLTPQGIGKMMAKLYEVAYNHLADPNTSKEMQSVLDGIELYKAVAPLEIKRAARRNSLAKTLELLKGTPEYDTVYSVWVKEGFAEPVAETTEEEATAPNETAFEEDDLLAAFEADATAA